MEALPQSEFKNELKVRSVNLVGMMTGTNALLHFQQYTGGFVLKIMPVLELLITNPS